MTRSETAHRRVPEAPSGEASVLGALSTLPDLLRHHARVRPGRRAVVFSGVERTYAELAEDGDRLGRRLLELGLRPGSRVGLLARNCGAYFELLAACGAARVVLTPVNWRLAPDEIAFILKDAEIEVLFVSSDYLDIATRLMAELGLPDRLILLDGSPPPPALAYIDWCEAGETGTDARLPGAEPGDVLLQIYSSGTTGTPKGVELTHGNMLAAAKQSLHGLVGCWSAEDRLLIPLPLFHAGALLTASYALLVGATNIVLKDAEVEALIAAVEREKATKIGLVPALMQMILEAPGFHRSRLASLDTIIYGGSAISSDLLRRSLATFDAGLVQLFGASETFTAGTVLSPEDHLSPSRVLTCGRPMHGISVRVVRPDGSDADPDEPGEVLIRSDTVMKGYWRRPDQSAEALRDGWYHTGDIGSLDREGMLTIRDRLRDMIISGGENIYPLEIENVLSEHVDVADCAVIGLPDTRWGETVMAVVVPVAGKTPRAEDLIDHLRKRIAGYKCPRAIAFVDALPRNASGKVLKRVLRETYREATAR
ncbi:MAG: long-chain-fatty-acid--CoA ligase [Brevundimonas sp.]|uniref:long-chain-fatty-acid--CoA ligase n=1 Tax=Brevundimonas sp. TaxID=1871086 RepID=UPI0027337A32|nr:long-chain-fatty-acid--CoA ligase [Brevundimonas sp.]MDP3403485.1 long-chain-fatty-acid--CoA ligase [Brevundimonas sp.]